MKLLLSKVKSTGKKQFKKPEFLSIRARHEDNYRVIEESSSVKKHRIVQQLGRHFILRCSQRRPIAKLKLNSTFRTESEQDNSPGVSGDRLMIKTSPDPSVKRNRTTRPGREGETRKQSHSRSASRNVTIFEADFSFMAENTKTIDQTKVFNEKLNGRLAMLGLTIGLVTEAITGNGIIQQVFGFFNSSIGFFLWALNQISWLFSQLNYKF